MRVLFLTHRLPYAPDRGDRVRAFHIVRTLAPRVDLTVVSLVHDRHELAQVERVRALGAHAIGVPTAHLRNYASATVALAGPQPLTHVLLDAPGFSSSLKSVVAGGRPDVVLAYCSSMARFALEPPLSSSPFVLDLVDVDSEKWAALADSASWPRRWVYQREARCLSRFERFAARRARATLVVNDREAAAIRRLAPEAAIRVLPVGVDLPTLRPPSAPSGEPCVIFCGVMNYQPNVDGVRWFSREVWPMLRARRPDARFLIVGANPTGAVRRLESDDHGIHVTGTVSDVREHLWSAAVSVAPLLMTREVQTKVLEAVAAGLPTVVTSQVAAGLPDEVLQACRVADSAEAFAEQTLSLLALSGHERRAAAAQADLSRLSWECQLAPLHGILADAASAGQPVTRHLSHTGDLCRAW